MSVQEIISGKKALSHGRSVKFQNFENDNKTKNRS